MPERWSASANVARLALALALLLAALPAPAQTPPLPATAGPAAAGPAAVLPLPVPAGEAALSASAAFTGDPARAIASGLVWRVYEDAGLGAKPALVARAEEAAPTFRLPPGAYVLNATYGFASVSKRVALGPAGGQERLAIGAGALRLAGAVGDLAIPAARLTFQVFVPIGSNSEGRLVRGGVRTGELVRLPEGTYHVVSTYGDSNAIMRTDLKVESGRVTEATLNHRAATVTLKLVAAPGTEAFAGTAFSVLTPGGDTIREAIGAFPQVTLAEGEYMLIARHDGQVFTREFKVESGLDRDVEVLVAKEVPKDGVRDGVREGVREPGREPPGDAPRDAPK